MDTVEQVGDAVSAMNARALLIRKGMADKREDIQRYYGAENDGATDQA